MTGEGEREEAGSERCRLIPGGFAGSGPTGSFFESPGWADREKPPGLSSQTEAVAPPGWWLDLITGKFLFSARAMDDAILRALNEPACDVTKGTANALAAANHLLNCIASKQQTKNHDASRK